MVTRCTALQLLLGWVVLLTCATSSSAQTTLVYRSAVPACCGDVLEPSLPALSRDWLGMIRAVSNPQPMMLLHNDGRYAVFARQGR